MKSKKSLEQGICILLIIAHAPADQCITSEHLSRRLGVSDSYLKKITRRLVLAGLIQSNFGKKGGFTMNRTPKKISLLDIFNAIEGDEPFVNATGLVEKFFIITRRWLKKEKKKS